MTDDEATAILFIDHNGMQWDVRELRSPGLQSMSPDRMSMPDFRNGWLLFTGANGERRRLAPFPANWRSLSHRQLAQLVDRARLATPRDQQAQADPQSASGRR